QPGLSPVAFRASTISSALFAMAILFLLFAAWRAWSIVERTGFAEGTALIDQRGIVWLVGWLLLDLLAEHFGTVLRLEPKVRGHVVIPPGVTISGCAVYDGMPDIRSEERALDERGQI